MREALMAFFYIFFGEDLTDNSLNASILIAYAGLCCKEQAVAD